MTAGSLALALGTYSAPAAPTPLAGNVVTGAMTGKAVGSGLAIANGAMHSMKLATWKIAAAVGGVAAVIATTVLGVFLSTSTTGSSANSRTSPPSPDTAATVTKTAQR
jgi:hypothetical protein